MQVCSCHSCLHNYMGMSITLQTKPKHPWAGGKQDLMVQPHLSPPSTHSGFRNVELPFGFSYFLSSLSLSYHIIFSVSPHLWFVKTSTYPSELKSGTTAPRNPFFASHPLGVKSSTTGSHRTMEAIAVAFNFITVHRPVAPTKL